MGETIVTPSGAIIRTGFITGRTSAGGVTVTPKTTAAGKTITISRTGGGGSGSRKTIKSSGKAKTIVVEEKNKKITTRAPTKTEEGILKLEEVAPKLAIVRRQQIIKTPTTTEKIQRLNVSARQAFQKKVDAGDIKTTGKHNININGTQFEFEIPKGTDLEQLKSGPRRTKLTKKVDITPFIKVGATKKELIEVAKLSKRFPIPTVGKIKQSLTEIDQKKLKNYTKLRVWTEKNIKLAEKGEVRALSKLPESLKRSSVTLTKDGVTSWARGLIKELPSRTIELSGSLIRAGIKAPLTTADGISFVKSLSTESGRKQAVSKAKNIPSEIYQNIPSFAKSLNPNTPSGFINLVTIIEGAKDIRNLVKKKPTSRTTLIRENYKPDKKGITYTRSGSTTIRNKRYTFKQTTRLSNKDIKLGKISKKSNVVVSGGGVTSRFTIPLGINLKLGVKTSKVIDNILKKRKITKTITGLTQKGKARRLKQIREELRGEINKLFQVPTTRFNRLYSSFINKRKTKKQINSFFKEVSKKGRERRLKQIKEEFKSELEKQLIIPKAVLGNINKGIKSRINITANLLKKSSIDPLKELFKITKRQFNLLSFTIKKKIINKVRLFINKLFERKVRAYEVSKKINLGGLRIKVLKELKPSTQKVVKEGITIKQLEIKNIIEKVVKAGGKNLVRNKKGVLVPVTSPKRLKRELRKAITRKEGVGRKLKLLPKPKGIKPRITDANINLAITKTLNTKRKNIIKKVKKIKETPAKDRQVLILKQKPVIKKQVIDLESDLLNKFREFKKQKQKLKQQETKVKQKTETDLKKVQKSKVKLETKQKQRVSLLQKRNKKLLSISKQILKISAALSIINSVRQDLKDKLKPLEKVVAIPKIKPVPKIQPKIIPNVAQFVVPLVSVIPTSRFGIKRVPSNILLPRSITWTTGQRRLLKGDIDMLPKRKIFNGLLFRSKKRFVYIPSLSALFSGAIAKGASRERLLRVGRVFTGLEERKIV